MKNREKLDRDTDFLLTISGPILIQSYSYISWMTMWLNS